METLSNGIADPSRNNGSTKLLAGAVILDWDEQCHQSLHSSGWSVVN